jgi:benzoylformate decarboxylase
VPSTVREVTYNVLRDLGMTTIFGNPGSSELPFLKDMPPDFRYVLALHERSAAGIALGYAIAKKSAAFVNLHSIASVGNGLSAIIDAHYCHAPLVITTGQQDRRQILKEPFLVSRALEVARPYVKWACEPLRPEDVPAAIARGYYAATQSPQGPVFISIPMDDWNRPCDPLSVRKVSRTVAPDVAALQEVARALESARNPAIVAGAQIEEDSAWQEVITLAEHLNARVYEEPLPSRWTFPRSHPLFSGGLLPAQKPLADQLAEHDVVLVLGAPVFLYYAYVPGAAIREGTKLFQITNSPFDAASAHAGTGIVGNIAAAAQFLYAKLKKREPRQTINQRAPVEPPPSHPMTTAYLFSTLNKLLPADAILAEECPSSKGDLDRCILRDQPGSFYSVRSGILGFGMPLAVGLEMGNPQRRVFAPIGDGSAQYSIQSLWTAVQHQVPVIFILIRNGDYSALRGFANFTNVGANVPGIAIPGIDAAKIAQGYGMTAWEVDKAEEFAPAIKRALLEKGPCLISVNVQPGGQTCMGMDQSVNPPNYG